MLPEWLLKELQDITVCPETLQRAKLQAQAFTRNQKMDFASAVSFLLDMRTTTVQTRLNVFFAHNGGGDPISQQGFSKLRANFDHSPFETMVRALVKEEYSGKYELPLWNDYHILADDGTYLQLPRNDVLRKEFGTHGGDGFCPFAGVSMLFDVLHGWVLDAIMTHSNMNEREECEKHIEFLWQELPHIAQKAILLLDRGYLSADLLETLQASPLKFLARCQASFLSPISNAPMGDSVVTLKRGGTVRVIKFTLSTGEVETLLTNLLDIPAEEFPGLYAMRWAIETAYHRLKRELCVEKFSGKTPNSVRQDFWASMVLMNSVAVFQQAADNQIQDRQKKKDLKHPYRARTSDLIITLRDRFIFAVLCGIPDFTKLEMPSIIKTMARTVSPLRPDRSFHRRFHRSLDANLNLLSCL